jgi:hypothetical protein
MKPLLTKAQLTARKSHKPPRAAPKPRSRVKKVNAKRGGVRFVGRADEAYRAFVRRQLCCFRHDCQGQIQAAHVISRGVGAFDAGNLVPLCASHHLAHHHYGLTSLWETAGVNLAEDAIRLYHRYLATMEPTDAK